MSDKFDFNPFEDDPIDPPKSSDADYKPTSRTNNYQEAFNETVKRNLKIASSFKDKVNGNGFNENGDPITPTEKGSGLKYANADDVAKYTHQEDYDPHGFNPDDTGNYDRWVAKESWGSTIGKAFDGFGYNFANTHNDGWKDYGRMANALVQFDTTKLTSDEMEMLEISAANDRNAMENYVFVPEDEQTDIFNKKFFAETLSSTGFALGTIAQISEEIIIDAIITGLSGSAGAGTFAITGSKIAASIGKAGLKVGLKSKSLLKKGSKLATHNLVEEAGEKTAKETARKAGKELVDEVTPKDSWASDFFIKGTNKLDDSVKKAKVNPVDKAKKEASEAAKAFKQHNIKERVQRELNAIFDANIEGITKSKTFLDFFENVAKGTPVLGQGVKGAEKMYHAIKAGESGATVAGMGYRSIRRMAQEFNLASVEANFEAISTYGETIDNLIAEEEAKTGKTIDATRLLELKEYALQASHGNYGTNLAILLATNQLQFGAIFNRFGPSNKVTREIFDALNNAEKKVINISDAAANITYKKGFFGIYGAVPSMVRDFGAVRTSKEIGKHLLRSSTRFELSEGLQENMQNISNSAWQDYYGSKADNFNLSLTNAFGQNVGNEFTKQGFNTFLIGAMTGMLIKGPVKLITGASSAAHERSVRGQYAEGQDPYTLADNKLTQDIDTVNDFMVELIDQKFETKLFNFTAQVESNAAQSKAAIEGDEHEFNNAKDNAMLSAAVISYRMGTIGAFQDTVRRMGDISEEQFEETFGIAIADTNYKTPQDFANKVADDIERYTLKLDSLNKEFKNKLEDPFDYEPESEDYWISSMMRNVQQDAISMIALNTLKGERTAERAEDVMKAYNKIES